MSISAAYVLHGISTPGDFLSQVTNARPSPRITTQAGVPSGLPYPLFIYNLIQNPDWQFDCSQVKALLDITGTSLGDISSGNTDLYFKAVTNKGTRTADASTAHIRLRAAEAVIVPLSIRATTDSPASMSARIVCLYDGTNEPIVPAGGVALAGTPVSEDHFVCGPVSVNATAINGVQDVSIDFGLSLIERRGDGELYISWLAVMEQRPVITIRTLSNPWATYGLNGNALTGLTVYLRKCAQTARVANATAEHIAFTATSGFVSIEETSAGGNEPGVTTIRCELSAPDATTAPLLVDTTNTIS